MAMTTEEKAKYDKAYYQRNKERIRERKRKAYKRNPNRLEYEREWEARSENKQRRREQKARATKKWGDSPEGKTRKAEYYLENRMKFKDTALQKKYGITLAQFNTMFLAQDCKCKICRTELEQFSEKGSKRPVVDHCHTTGEVRGILCGECNRGLGLFQDKIELVREAMMYLSETQNT